MSNRSYTSAQIYVALAAYDNGATQIEAAETIGCSPASITFWRTKYQGMKAAVINAEVRKGFDIEALRRANTRLLAEQRAWTFIVKELRIPLARRMLLFNQITKMKLVSSNQAKRLLKMRAPTEPVFERDDAVVIQKMRDHLAANPGHGFSTMFHQILKGKVCGSTRGRRLYNLENLQQFVRNRRRNVEKRHSESAPKGLTLPPGINHTWSIDFMHLRLKNGAPLRSLNVIDDFSRECLLIRGSHTTSSRVVVRQLHELVETRGKPMIIRCDNGPEFKADVFHQWADQQGIVIAHIDPYQSWQNGFIERFNRSLRHDVLHWDTFLSLNDFDTTAEAYRLSYNNIRPHTGLAWRTPTAFAEVSKRAGVRSAEEGADV